MQISEKLRPVSKTPFLVSAVFFVAAAVFIMRVTATKLEALELVCLGACLAAAGACAAIPFSVAYACRNLPAVPTGPAPATATTPVIHAPVSLIDPEALTSAVAAAVDARLAVALPDFTTRLAEAIAALEDKRRTEVLLAVAENSAIRPLDSDSTPASSGKSRLGRGLDGLIRGNMPKPPVSSDEARAT